MGVNGLRLPWLGGRTKERLGVEAPYQERTRHRRRVHISDRTLIMLFGVILIGIPMLATTAYGVWYTQDRQIPRDVTQTYWYDAQNERWINVVQEQKVVANVDGSYRSGSHTVIINVSEENPIKQIVVQEALVINPSSTDPLLEINGNPNSLLGDSTPKINIGTLEFRDVDAKIMEIKADVVRSSVQNVVAKDNELHLELDVVNVVVTARGAASSLFLGVSRATTADRASIKAGIGEEFNNTSKETGMRVDRIRILGPGSSGTGFIESLVIARSSVRGKISVKDVGIQDLVLNHISLDDS